MAKVILTVQTPDQQSVKRGGKIDFKNGFEYPASFYLESSGSKRPTHRGPVVEVSIISDDGTLLHSENKTIVLVDKGQGQFDIELRSLMHVASSMESIDSDKKAVDNTEPNPDTEAEKTQKKG